MTHRIPPTMDEADANKDSNSSRDLSPAVGGAVRRLGFGLGDRCCRGGGCGGMIRINPISEFAYCTVCGWEEDDPASILRQAIETFVHAYRARYVKPATGGVRADAPMRAEVAELNAVLFNADTADRQPSPREAS